MVITTKTTTITGVQTPPSPSRRHRIGLIIRTLCAPADPRDPLGVHGRDSCVHGLRGKSQGAKQHTARGAWEVPMARFRNNLTIRGTERWAEDAWFIVRSGGRASTIALHVVDLCVHTNLLRHRHRIGTVTFFRTFPISHCIMMGIDQGTGEKDAWASPGPLDTLRNHHSILGEAQGPREGYFCLGALPLQAGTVRVGTRWSCLRPCRGCFKEGESVLRSEKL
ncbi:hypothetical protein BC936DRAFT_138976 [Jimgerdemannia flammicorona]|uniref:Uncharacterized protein n=1 Tax=Jimgerdemannia flammicorona TaxID=994334 RepID=A0A433BBN6_9FUNG|nr:hypothetical protein BC936DRAFT_138976 [Jimgerdemannia flammicorona]